MKMKKTTEALAVLLWVAAGAGAQDWTGAGASRLFSNYANWSATPSNAAQIKFSETGTSVSSPALVDTGWNITNGTITIGAGTLAGTNYACVAVLSGAKLIGSALQLGNASSYRPGQLELRSGSSLNSTPAGTGVLMVGRTNDGSGVLIVENNASFKWGTINLQGTGVLRYKAASTSLPVFESTKNNGGSNILNGKIEVDLFGLLRDETAEKEYTLISNAFTTQLSGALLTWITNGGGKRKGTGSQDFASFAVLNGDGLQWELYATNAGKNLILNVIPEPVTRPPVLYFSRPDGRLSVNWQGQPGIHYELEHDTNVYFTNNLPSRYFFGHGTNIAVDCPVDAPSGFWKARASRSTNGVSVARSGQYAGKLVRYDAAGNPSLLRAFGVNYYDGFTRYLKTSNDLSFVDGFAYLQSNSIPVVRFIAGGFFPKDWELYFNNKAEYYRRLDRFVAEAEGHQIGLILSLFFNGKSTGEMVRLAVAGGVLVPGVDFVPNNPLFLDKNGNPTYAEYTTDFGREESGTIAWIRHYTRELVERYAGSPAVWGWEFGNEINLMVDHPAVTNMRSRDGSIAAQGMVLPETTNDTNILPLWTGPDDLQREQVDVAKKAFAETVRSIDGWRMILSGDSKPRTSAYHNWTEHAFTRDSRAELAQIFPVDNPSPMDTVYIHVYPTKPGAAAELFFADPPVVTNVWLTGQYKELLDYFVAQSSAIGRPLVVGEWGSIGDGTTQDEKDTFQRFMQALVDSGVQLSLLWTFDNRNAGQVSEWWVNPGTPKEYQLTNDDPDRWDLKQANLLFGND